MKTRDVIDWGPACALMACFLGYFSVSSFQRCLFRKCKERIRNEGSNIYMLCSQAVNHFENFKHHYPIYAQANHVHKQYLFMDALYKRYNCAIAKVFWPWHDELNKRGHLKYQLELFHWVSLWLVKPKYRYVMQTLDCSKFN